MISALRPDYRRLMLLVVYNQMARLWIVDDRCCDRTEPCDAIEILLPDRITLHWTSDWRSCLRLARLVILLNALAEYGTVVYFLAIFFYKFLMKLMCMRVHCRLHSAVPKYPNRVPEIACFAPRPIYIANMAPARRHHDMKDTFSYRQAYTNMRLNAKLTIRESAS